MRIARYVMDDEPTFGTVELASDGGEFPDTVSAISGDPLVGPVHYTGDRRALNDVRLLAPVLPRSKVIGLGDTYANSAEELASRRSAGPFDYLMFLKPNTSVIGPGEPIILPSESKNVWFEGELAIVIGRYCRRVAAEQADQVIFGYTIGNDVTAKDLMVPGRPWDRPKGFDSFCPLGPWIVSHWTSDDLAAGQLTSSINGEARQDSPLGLLVPTVGEIVALVSSWTTLLPGDVILTGAPAGPGPIVDRDTVAIDISGLGTLSNPVFAEDQ